MSLIGEIVCTQPGTPQAPAEPDNALSRLPPSHPVAQFTWHKNALSQGSRTVPEETPVALTYDGTSYAVMMATPSDLADFAIGFSLTEGVVQRASEIESLEIIDVDGGVEARMWLKGDAAKRHMGKRRSILGPTGCGLCGVESIAQAIKAAPQVTGSHRVSPSQIIEAMRTMQNEQALHVQTRAVHAAALWKDGGLIVREDVGRHNALDKLIGAAVSANVTATGGIVLLTSRVSVELVQKSALFGASIIAAVSAPTALAVRMADAAGITLVAIVRDDGFEIFTHADRIVTESDTQG